MIWTFGRKLAAGFSLAGLTLLVLAGSGYRNTQQLIENNHWVNHTHEVQQQLARLLSLMVDAETGERGYIITGDDAFLEPYRAARLDIATTADEIGKLTLDNAAQQHRMQALRPLLDTRLTRLAARIELRRSAGFVAASTGLSEGKLVMDNVRRAIAEMAHAESLLLQQRDAQAEASATTTQAILLWGTLLGVALMAGVGGLMAHALARQVGSAVRHIQSSSSELQTAATQQATSSREQSSAMTEIQATIRELLASSRQIADSAQRVAQIADHTATSAQGGDTTVENGKESVALIRKHVDVMLNQMRALRTKSQQIGVVLDIVSELADQTNILAINASIEATFGGEFGARFGVVADEIRKLADRVAESTKEIRTLVEDVRGAVITTLATSETGSLAVDAGAQRFAEVTAAFGQIRTQVTTTTEAAREIELSTKQQTTAVEQVNSALNSVSQAAQESEVSTAQTQRTAAELSKLSRELLRIVESEAKTQPRARLSA